jgi:hypothetical protein
MEPCKICGGEILPLCGGKPRVTTVEGGDLGVGHGPVIGYCRECLLREYRLNLKSNKAERGGS